MAPPCMGASIQGPAGKGPGGSELGQPTGGESVSRPVKCGKLKL